MTYLLILIAVLVLIIGINHLRKGSLGEALKYDTSPDYKKHLVQSKIYKAPPGYTVDAITVQKDLELRTATWRTTADTEKGTIQIMTGRGEFIEKYYETIRDFLALGWNILIFDWRGQGLSSRLLRDEDKGYVEDFDQFLKDAQAVYQNKMKHLPHPHMLLGHSMGGHLALRELQDHPYRYQRAVLCAPMQSIVGLPTGILGRVSYFFSLMGLGQAYVIGGKKAQPDKKIDKYTSDLKRFRKWTSIYRKEPRLLMGSATWKWSEAASESMTHSMLPDQIKRIMTPTYVASAKSDTIVDSDTHDKLDDHNPVITVVPYPGARHEIYTEVDEYRSKFIDSLDAFFSERK